jgi:hypothetical protein
MSEETVEKLYAFFLHIMDSVFSMAAVYTIVGGLLFAWVLTMLDELYQQFKKRS